MQAWRNETKFEGRIVMLGFGGVGQGVLPLLLRHIELRPRQIEIIKPSDKGLEVAREYGVSHTVIQIDRDNCRQVLEPRLNLRVILRLDGGLSWSHAGILLV